MKKMILILGLLVQTACASSTEVRMIKKYDSIHPEFQPYIQEFIYASQGAVRKSHFRNFTMGFRDYPDKDDTIGTCHYLANEVDIGIDWWNKSASQSQKIELVFHELGHCILKRGHTKKPTKEGFEYWMERLLFNLGIFSEKEYLPDGCPASFMHPYNLGDDCINKHFNYYINELFYRHDRQNYVQERKTQSVNSTYQESCKKPKVINKTNEWNKRDEATLNRAKTRCIENYNSCLKTFWKNTHNSYSALCE